MNWERPPQKATKGKKIVGDSVLPHQPAIQEAWALDVSSHSVASVRCSLMNAYRNERRTGEARQTQRRGWRDRLEEDGDIGCLVQGLYQTARVFLVNGHRCKCCGSGACTSSVQKKLTQAYPG